MTATLPPDESDSSARDCAARWLNANYGTHLFGFVELENRSEDSRAAIYAKADDLLRALDGAR